MPTPPITHYKDEEPEQTQEILNKELDREAEKVQETNETPELKVLPVKKQEKKITNSSNIVTEQFQAGHHVLHNGESHQRIGD